jgi:DNA-binding winged helix-turn-helix (wHTH) protein
MTDAGTRFHYEFGEFRLDPQQRVLTGGAEARPIALVPKAFETLLYLLERRGELLGKNSLLKAIWPNIVVEENSLNQTISAIRRSLGERPGEHRFIVTEPGRGYRFVADVRVVTAAVKAGRGHLAAESAPAPAAEPHTSIAVRQSHRRSGQGIFRRRHGRRVDPHAGAHSWTARAFAYVLILI